MGRGVFSWQLHRWVGKKLDLSDAGLAEESGGGAGDFWKIERSRNRNFARARGNGGGGYKSIE